MLLASELGSPHDAGILAMCFTPGKPGRETRKGVVAVTGFTHPALAQLTDQQVRFAPPARRQEQLARAEKLLNEIDPAKQYPYQFVCYRITDFRPESYPDLLIAGADLLGDLRLMIQAPSSYLNSNGRGVPIVRSDR